MLKVEHLVALSCKIVFVRGSIGLYIFIWFVRKWELRYPYALCEPRRKNAINGKTMGEGGHLTPKHCSYAFVYVYLLVQSNI